MNVLLMAATALIRVLREARGNRKEKKSVRKEAAEGLSCLFTNPTFVLAENGRVVDEILSRHGFAEGISQCLLGSDFETKKEALVAAQLATAAMRTAEPINQMVKGGLIEALCEIIKMKDVGMVAGSLETLGQLLEMEDQAARREGSAHRPCVEMIESCGGLDTLEELQTKPNRKIYESASRLIEQFFGAEEEDIVIVDNMRTKQAPPFDTFVPSIHPEFKF
eukprot:TRINITY_DN4034_c0_g1_i3.p1 TRINITY_DN4034_c0_g1~~TRINITY_DN4034_c0_g1_i3.p1  ORF type:complete len:222 (-),score=46.62 TRINITY_DN4034_c0_g1_i3:27-692(-)